MNLPSRPGPRTQEAVFSIFMALAALLGAWDPRLHYPQILWVFGAFLVFNACGHLALRRIPAGWLERAARVLVFGNIALVASILRESGGACSYFWPMYLLPLFTSCLYLSGRETRRWVVVASATLGATYLGNIGAGELPRLLDLAVKVAGLALAAAVAGRASARERMHGARFERDRRRLDRIARRAQADEAAATSLPIDGLLHGLGNPITVILGSVDLLLSETPETDPRREDLMRIRASVARCRGLLDCLRAWTGGAPTGGGVAAAELLGEMLRLLEHQVMRRGVSISRELPIGLPAFGVRSLPVQQAVLSLFHQVVERTADGGKIRVTAAPRPGGIDLRLVARGLREGAAAEGLRPCRDLLRRHGGELETRALEGVLECDAVVPAGAA